MHIFAKKVVNDRKNVPTNRKDGVGARRSVLARGPLPALAAVTPPQHKSVVFSWMRHTLGSLEVYDSKSVHKRKLTHRISTKVVLCCGLM